MQNVLKQKKITPVVQPSEEPSKVIKKVDFIEQKYIRGGTKIPPKNTEKKSLNPKVVQKRSTSQSHLLLHNLHQRYLRYYPMLFFSLVGYGIGFFIVTRIEPQAIQNFLVPNSYLPFFIALILGNFFFFSFVCLNTGRGFRITLFLTLLFFFRIQQVLTLSIAVGIIIFWGILEFLLALFLSGP